MTDQDMKAQEPKHPKPLTSWKIEVYGRYSEHSYEIRSRNFDDGTTVYQTAVCVGELKSDKDLDILTDMADYLGLTFVKYREPRDRDWLNGHVPLDKKMVVTYIAPYSVSDPRKVIEYQMDKMHEFVSAWDRCFVKEGRVCKE